MQFREALGNIGTESGDVEGVEKRLGKKVVRRKLPAGYEKDVRKKKKKKEDEEELDELFVQISGDAAHMKMGDFWDEGEPEPEDDEPHDEKDFEFEKDVPFWRRKK